MDRLLRGLACLSRIFRVQLSAGGVHYIRWTCRTRAARLSIKDFALPYICQIVARMGRDARACVRRLYEAPKGFIAAATIGENSLSNEINPYSPRSETGSKEEFSVRRRVTWNAIFRKTSLHIVLDDERLSMRPYIAGFVRFTCIVFVLRLFGSIIGEIFSEMQNSGTI